MACIQSMPMGAGSLRSRTRHVLCEDCQDADPPLAQEGGPCRGRQRSNGKPNGAGSHWNGAARLVGRDDRRNAPTDERGRHTPPAFGSLPTRSGEDIILACGRYPLELPTVNIFPASVGVRLGLWQWVCLSLSTASCVSQV